MTTNKQIVEQSIKDFILKEFLPGEEASSLTTTTALMTTGVLDSIATLKLVGFLEQEFSISIAPHETDAEYLDSIDRISQLVLGKLA